jgi:hypothetical protein
MGIVMRKRCHTSTDACIDDSHCAKAGGAPAVCAYSTSAGHWACAAQMLCP